jgi:hypothetical protein
MDQHNSSPNCQTETPTPTPIVNKGTGAGGAKTNINGLPYEEQTALNTHYILCNYHEYKKNKYKIIKFIGYDYEFVNLNKAELHKYMKQIEEKHKSLQPAAGCKNPDEAYVDLQRKLLFIIEKKFQQTSGSVDEKIQTGHFKQQHYRKLFPNFKVYYIYCLSDWFKKKEYESVLTYLQENNISIFWGNDDNYKNNIISFMCSDSNSSL